MRNHNFSLLKEKNKEKRSQSYKTYALTVLPIASVILALSVLAFADRQLLTLGSSSIVVIAGVLCAVLTLWQLRSLHKANNAILERVRQEANTDELTGLLNRRGIRALCDEASSRGDYISLLICNLDKFKEVNDVLGRHYGDQLLQSVAQRISSVETDVNHCVSHLSSDEFVIMALNVKTHDELNAFARQIHEAIVRPVIIDGAPLAVEVSIGVASCCNGSLTPSETFQRANNAMYYAKRNGRGVHHWNGEEAPGTVDRLRLTSELREAIERGELFLYYQPKMNVQSEHMEGVEALVRWNHPVRGLISPVHFIPFAESTALIHPLTSFVLDTAIRQAALWKEEGNPITVSVNLSPRSLLRGEIVEEVSELLARYDLPAHLLEVEVTESAIIENPVKANEVLLALRSMGITLSLDDFGAGYTSLSQLQSLPLDVLKVDRSLVSKVTQDVRRNIILSNIIAMASDLGLKVVAEGVEDRETFDLLALANCASVQGFLFSPPIAPEALKAWVESQSSGDQETVLAV